MPQSRLSARVPKLKTPTAANNAAAFERLGRGNYHGIAKRSGMTLQHVSRVLRGIRGVSFTVASQIADGASVTLDQLRAFRAANGADRPKGRGALGRARLAAARVYVRKLNRSHGKAPIGKAA